MDAVELGPGLGDCDLAAGLAQADPASRQSGDTDVDPRRSAEDALVTGAASSTHVNPATGCSGRVEGAGQHIAKAGDVDVQVVHGQAARHHSLCPAVEFMLGAVTATLCRFLLFWFGGLGQRDLGIRDLAAQSGECGQGRERVVELALLLRRP